MCPPHSGIHTLAGYCLLLDSLDGIVTLTESGKVHEANRRFADMLGYSSDEIRGMHVWDWDVDRSREALLERISSEDAAGSSVVTHCRRKDGVLLEVEITSKAACWKGRKYVFCVCRDITAQRLEERFAQDQTRILEMIAQAAPAAETLEQLAKAVEAQGEGVFCSVLMVDEDGLRLRSAASPSLPPAYTRSIDGIRIGPEIGCCGTAAHRREPVVAEDIFTDPLWKNFREAAVLSGMRACWSSPILDRGRNVLGTFALYSRQPGQPSAHQQRLIRSATHTAAICISRARAEAALRRSEEVLLQAQSIAHVGNWVFDVESGLFTGSLEAWRIAGWGPGSHSVSELEARIHPEDLDRVRASIVSALEGRPLQVEHRFIQDGDIRWVDVRAVAERDASGRVVRINGITQDISERKQAELVQRQLEAQLRQSQKMEAIGTLAGGVAHDFNNILGVILGCADLALRDSGANPGVCEQLDAVMLAARRARHLVKQILTFGRREDQRRSVIHMHLLLEESMQLLRAALPANIELRTQVTDPLPSVLGDATLIEQVLMNLATNAAQAIGERPGHLDIELSSLEVGDAPTSLHPGLKPGQYVRLSIRDDGPGIDPSIQHRVFEPFFTTKGAGQGTGLGLAVVHGIIHSHEGVINFRSHPGAGTTFEISLPAATSPTASPAPATPPLPLSRSPGHERILLVDDEPSLLKVAERMLSRSGYHVTACANANDAKNLFLADPHRFDLVITDYSMPDQTGLELGLELLALRPRLPILICTGYGAGLTREKALEAGILDVLQKPLEWDELCAAIRSALPATTPSSPPSRLP